jgi:alpha-glucosidase
MRRTTLRTTTALTAALLLLVGVSPGGAEPITTLKSPGGAVEVAFSLSAEGAPRYSVSFRGRPVVVDSGLGLTLHEVGPLSTGFRVVDTRRASRDERYAFVAGKTREGRDHCEEMTVALEQHGPPPRRLEVVFRAYDDGAALRYVLPRQPALHDVEIASEETQFRFTGDHRAWALFLPSFTTSNEREFVPVPLLAIKPESIVGPPLVVELGDGLTVALAEANLKGYAGLHLARVEGGNQSRFPTLVTKLAPLPTQPETAVRGATPLVTPWRVLVIGDRPGALIESTLVHNLSDPSEIADTSWIKPGKVAWDWWNGPVVPGAPFKAGMNNDTFKHFIDFAGEFGLEYMLIDAGWYGTHRDVTADITRSIPEMDIPGLVAYGGERKVGILLWLNWENVRDQMDLAFPVYEKWGVRGIKVDYMNRKDQEIVAFYRQVLRAAARYHLTVDFHGAYAPTGEERTWPNLLTREGILGLEYSKWSDRATPRHNVTIPFTRMLVGPMDYTPGAFRNVTVEAFAPRNDAPVAMGTRAHHLAMYVVYDSPLQMLSDTPAAYRGEPGADFLKVVPASWDETRALDGRIGEYVVIARRRGADWFIGAMTDAPRTVEVPLSFLGAGAFEATVYADVPESATAPTRIGVTLARIPPGPGRRPLVLNLVRGGGAAVQVRPATP